MIQLSSVVPVVDLSEFTGNNPETRNSFVQQLGSAYEEVGFVAVKNHGLSEQLIAELYEYVQHFFFVAFRNQEKI